MRYYNGCPDTKLRNYLDRQDALHKELSRFNAYATYFPNEEKWMVFKDCKIMTPFCNTLEEAVLEYKAKHDK